MSQTVSVLLAAQVLFYLMIAHGCPVFYKTADYMLLLHVLVFAETTSTTTKSLLCCLACTTTRSNIVFVDVTVIVYSDIQVFVMFVNDQKGLNR